jgi:hypothetical protein
MNLRVSATKAVVWRVNTMRAQTSTQRIAIIFSGSFFDSFISNRISFRLFPSSSRHCHSSGFLQKLQCNLLYEVYCEVTAIGSFCSCGVFKQCNCCTVTVIGYVLWETNTAVEWVTCQLLIQEVQIHVSSWGLAILTYIRGFSQSPPDKFRLLVSNYVTVVATQTSPSSLVTDNSTDAHHRIWASDVVAT